MSAAPETPFILIGLQWTKVGPGATLQCNVDRLNGSGNSRISPTTPNQTSHIKRVIPWICIYAASAS
jgi:hypothetical protein